MFTFSLTCVFERSKMELLKSIKKLIMAIKETSPQGLPLKFDVKRRQQLS